VLGTTRSRSDGSFRIGSPRPARRGETRYVTADGGALRPSVRSNSVIRFATILGRGHAPSSVTLNERTTAAAAFALAQFVVGRQFDGPSPGLPNAAATFRNLVALRTGKLSRVINKCPAGKRSVRAPISPRNGYGFDGLVRNTGVSIDPSGNVWHTNNWRIVPNRPNPGGHQMVVFIGLAEPVRTPLFGPVRTP
jgi:hypothetical protein